MARENVSVPGIRLINFISACLGGFCLCVSHLVNNVHGIHL